MDSWAKLEIGVVMTLLGMGIVFSVLVFLAAVLKLMERVLSARPRKTRIPAPGAPPPAPPAPASAAGADGTPLAAVIAAAVAACTGAGTPPVIRSIRRAGDALPAWGRLGRQEQIASRKIP